MSERLIAIIAQFSSVSPILPETRLKEDLQLDSMQLVRLVVMVEDTFRVTIPDSAIRTLYTVADVAAFVDQKGDD